MTTHRIEVLRGLIARNEKRLGRKLTQAEILHLATLVTQAKYVRLEKRFMGDTHPDDNAP